MNFKLSNLMIKKVEKYLLWISGIIIGTVIEEMKVGGLRWMWNKLLNWYHRRRKIFTCRVSLKWVNRTEGERYIIEFRDREYRASKKELEKKINELKRDRLEPSPSPIHIMQEEGGKVSEGRREVAEEGLCYNNQDLIKILQLFFWKGNKTLYAEISGILKKRKDVEIRLLPDDEYEFTGISFDGLHGNDFGCHDANIFIVWDK